MKGSNSRFSHRPDHRYSNTAHVQGGMVTDADLTEAGQLHQARDEAQSEVTVWSGSPEVGGVIAREKNDPTNVTLQQGSVVAQGKQGRLVAASGNTNLTGQALFEGQADLPNGPALPEREVFLYADLWERPVFSAQESHLADAGLHGAETSYRTRTMVQIKALPLTADITPERAQEDLENGVGLFRRKGDVRVTVTKDTSELAKDDCDPCADKVDLKPEVPNALFRLEVVEVSRDAKGKAQTARFAWSAENASEIALVDMLKEDDTSATIKAGFGRENAVYQYFNDTTEAQIGQFAPDIVPVASEFDTDLTHRAMTHVRRWDGAAVVNLRNSTVPQNGKMGRGTITAGAGAAKLVVDHLALDIQFEDRAIMVGDYWLIELRRFAPEDARITLVGSDDNKDAPPIGIEHHFCGLFVGKGAHGTLVSDADKRRLSFPTLTDIPASHVDFDPACPKLFHNAENVSDALNALCDLDADDVAFDPPTDCERFAGAKTVDDALKKLCKVQDDTMLTRLFRTMMDWGVVCGLKFTLEKPGTTQISWTAGTILDRTGRLLEIKAGDFDLRKVPQENIQGKLNELMNRDGEICLSIGVSDKGEMAFYFTSHKIAFGPNDPTFMEAVRACREGRKWVDFGGATGKLDDDGIAAVKKMADVWANWQTFGKHVSMTRTEEKTASSVTNSLVKDYMGKATEERAARVERLVEKAGNEIKPDRVGNPKSGQLRMQRQATIFGIIAAAEEEDDRNCECRNAFVPCPPEPGKFGHLVPVACFKMQERSSTLMPLTELCGFCCRKQAMTWRSFRYYEGSFIDPWMAEMKGACCGSKEPEPGRDWDDWFDDYAGHVYPRPLPAPLPMPEPEPNPLWPPVKYPGGVLGPNAPFGPRDPRWTTPIPETHGGLLGVKPEILDLRLNEATDRLTGSGFDVVETLDIRKDPEALGKLSATTNTVWGRETAQPGDKVALIMSDGMGLDYLVVEKGEPKLPFETEAAVTARVERIVASFDFGKSVGLETAAAAAPRVAEAPTVTVPDEITKEISELEGKIKGMLKDRELMQNELGHLTEMRGKLSEDVAGLQAQMNEMSKLNGALTKDVARSKAELLEISQLKNSSLEDISSATKELRDMQAAHTDFVGKMRREQPIETVLGNNKAAINALKAKGIVTVGDVEKTNTRTLTTHMARTGMNGTTARKLAGDFIKKK